MEQRHRQAKLSLAIPQADQTSNADYLTEQYAEVAHVHPKSHVPKILRNSRHKVKNANHKPQRSNESLAESIENAMQSNSEEQNEEARDEMSPVGLQESLQTPAPAPSTNHSLNTTSNGLPDSSANHRQTRGSTSNGVHSAATVAAEKAQDEPLIPHGVHKKVA